MTKLLLSLAATALIAVSPSPVSAQTLKPFAYFGDKGQQYPESITRDREGNLYLSLTMAGKIKKVTPQGRQSDFAQIPDDWLLGVTFDPLGNLVVAGDFGLWKVSPSGYVWLFAKVPGHISLNDLTYDHDGNLYVTDDSLFVIWKVDPQGNAVIWSSSPYYTVHDQTFPVPTGCNGIAFSEDMRTLFVTNTSDGLVLAVTVNPNGTAGALKVIASGLIGVDAIRVDDSNNLYIAQNIENKIVQVSPKGKVTTLTERGLLAFPTSLVFGRDCSTLFICNNGNAFISDTPSGQGVLKLELKR